MRRAPEPKMRVSSVGFVAICDSPSGRLSQLGEPPLWRCCCSWRLYSWRACCCSSAAVTI
jgi:hypothetical protein